MTFLYFLPISGNVVTREQLETLGLGYAFETSPTCAMVPGAGPSGSSGIIVAQGKRAKGRETLIESAHVGYYPDRQKWRAIPGSNAWCGHYTDDRRPTRDNLSRDSMIAGKLIELLDGQKWTAPIARQWHESDDGRVQHTTTLPRSLDVSEQGEWLYTTVVPRYLPLWQLSERVWNYRAQSLEPQELEEWHVQGRFDAACQVLQANYRVGVTECAMLGLLSTEHVGPILDALIDFETVEAYLAKKKDSK